MEIVNIIDLLDTNPKKKPWKKRKATNNIAIHHSQVDNQTAFNYNTWHINNNNWYRISYHYVIEETGLVYKCNEDDDYTYHVGNSNKDTIGICLPGNLDDNSMTNSQLMSLIELITELIFNYDLHSFDVKGHRVFPLSSRQKTKTCPGEKTDMECIRCEVAKLLTSKYNDIIWALEQKYKRFGERPFGDEKAFPETSGKKAYQGKFGL